MQKTIILMALLAGAFAAPNVKSRLAQQNSKNLAEMEEVTPAPQVQIQAPSAELTLPPI